METEGRISLVSMRAQMRLALISAIVLPMNKEVELEVRADGIALLRVNRPEARNALSWAAQEAFADCVTAANHNDAIRVLIIAGANGSFVSGGDLKELSGHPDKAAGERLNRVMSAALAQLTDLPCPVIAAVDGDAVGGGCEILTACDLRVASADARFAFRQIHNGLTTGWGGTSRLVALIGQSRAMELLLTGRTFDAAEAQALGLIHRVAPAGTGALDAAYAWAEELRQLPRHALAALKTLVQAATYLPSLNVNRLETQLFTRLWPAADHIEAMDAFVQKRAPRFNQDL